MPLAVVPTPTFHNLSQAEALAAIASQPTGLTTAEASDRLHRYGPNQLVRADGEGLLRLAWRQINNPISWVLVGAGVLAIVLGRHTDSLVVFGAVVVNAIIGFVQEHRAGQAIAALSAMVPDYANVLRDGSPISLPAADLVPGDVVLLASGDKVPADLRLLSVRNLNVIESALTGESVPVAKQADAVAADAVLGDRLDMAFGGTLVTQGTAQGLVVATGNTSELGRINALLNKTVDQSTPLTKQLAQVSAWITGAVMVLSVLLFAWGWLYKSAKPGEALFAAVTLAVAAIPEGLPAIITIALAIGVRRMAARHAVVRHLPAVETLGSTSVICSDKTGTLTRNEMTVRELWTPVGACSIAGIGYTPDGVFSRDGVALPEVPAEVRDLLLASVLCNDAGLVKNEDGWVISGDPTEASLVVAGRKAGFDETDLRRRHARIDVLPFESDTKYMATLNRGDGVDAVFLKGAPEMVMARCGLDVEITKRIRVAQEALAAQGMRVLAAARRAPDAGQTTLTAAWVERGFTFLGLIGMIDPPRDEAIAAIAACHRAGITVKMITGDHHLTAAAIGRQLGILGNDGESLSGSDLDQLDQAGLRAAARRCHVFARVAPEHKIKLVEALQDSGAVVAMTGDGVNDAPALKRADIGIAMGITGTAVSKEAAKIVLADDNFATIAAAVEEGRRVYDNLIKALAFILPTNLGLAVILAAAMVAFPTVTVQGLGTELLLPMSPTQILWINLVASIALSLPLAFEVLEPSAMLRPPRRREEPVFSRFILVRTLLVAALMAAAACLLFLFEYLRTIDRSLDAVIPADVHAYALAEAQTIAVTSVVCFQIAYLLHCRSLRGQLGSLGWFSNRMVWLGIAGLLLLQAGFTYLPFMNGLFTSAPLDAGAWLRAALAGAVILPVVSIEKWWRRRAGRRLMA